MKVVTPNVFNVPPKRGEGGREGGRREGGGMDGVRRRE